MSRTITPFGKFLGPGAFPSDPSPLAMYTLPRGRNEQQRLNGVACAVLKRHDVAGNLVIDGYTRACTTGERCVMCKYHGRPDEAEEFGCAVPRIRRVAVLLNLVARGDTLPRRLADPVAFVRDVDASDVAPFVADVMAQAQARQRAGALRPAPPAAPPPPPPPPAPRSAKATRNSLWRIWFGDAPAGHCYSCDVEIERGNSTSWHAGHVIARAELGTDEMHNLVPQCDRCNLRQRTEDVDVYARRNFPDLHVGRNRRDDFPHLPAHMRRRRGERPAVNVGDLVNALGGLTV